MKKILSLPNCVYIFQWYHQFKRAYNHHSKMFKCDLIHSRPICISRSNKGIIISAGTNRTSFTSKLPPLYGKAPAKVVTLRLSHKFRFLLNFLHRPENSTGKKQRAAGKQRVTSTRPTRPERGVDRYVKLKWTRCTLHRRWTN